MSDITKDLTTKNATKPCTAQIKIGGGTDGDVVLLCARTGEHTKHLELEAKPHADTADEHWVWAWVDSSVKPTIEYPDPTPDLVGGVAYVPGEVWAQYRAGDPHTVDLVNAAADAAGLGGDFLDFRDWTEGER